MREHVFLNSGIFIAFLNAHDQWHEQAVALFSVVNPRWSTSYVIISETYSWFLHRHGEEAARSFRRLIDDLGGLRIFDMNQPDFRTSKCGSQAGSLPRYPLLPFPANEHVQAGN